MAYPLGFTWVKGPFEIIESVISSSCTVRRGVPVSVSSVGRVIREYISTDTCLLGIAQHDAANSFPGRAGRMLVLIPTPDTVFATQVQTGVATSALSPGQGFALEKSGNFFRVDVDSVATPPVYIVPRENWATCDSADSSVWVKFYSDRLFLNSRTSVGIAS